MRVGFRVLTVVLLLAIRASATAEQTATQVFVILDGKPVAGLRLSYWDFESEDLVQATTDENGIALFPLGLEARVRLQRVPDPFLISVVGEDDYSSDFMIDPPTLHRFGVRIVAHRSAKWVMRTKPRVCDELFRVGDIPIGGLASLSADEYNHWYSGLAPATITNCKTLSRLQAQTGSLAPWYFYAYKGQEHECRDGLAEEIDWATWYRGLLEESTGANPGNCEEDWERWWRSKGYEPVPANPRPKPEEAE